MAKDNLRQYDSLAANNADVGGVDTSEGMLPSKVNDAIRELMSHLADFQSGTEKVDAIAVDNLKLDGNTLSSTDTNGNIVLDPNGTGKVVAEDIISTTTNGDINITPNGTGAVVIDGLSHPTADGTAGQFLKTDGSGNLSFDGAGKILQVVQAHTSSTASFTPSSTWTTLTGLSVNITPSSTSSKILLMASVAGNGDNRYFGFGFFRDSTAVGHGSGSGNRFGVGFPSEANNSESFNNIMMRNASSQYLDSPSTTSQITYTVKVRHYVGGQSFYLNRTENDSDNIWIHRGASSIIAIEVAG
jgi:hypothetical protein